MKKDAKFVSHNAGSGVLSVFVVTPLTMIEKLTEVQHLYRCIGEWHCFWPVQVKDHSIAVHINWANCTERKMTDILRFR